MHRRRLQLAGVLGTCALLASGFGSGALAASTSAGPSQWLYQDMGPTHDAVYHASAPGVSWSRQVPGGVIGGLSVIGNTVYGGSLNGTVFALNEKTGAVIWEKHLENQAFNPPNYVDGRLLYGTGNDVFVTRTNADWIRGTPPNALYALNPKTGQVIWKVPTIGNNKNAPIYYEGLLYDGTGHHGLRAINPITGKVVWRVNDGGLDNMSSAIPYHGLIILNTAGPGPGGLRAFSARTGRLVWTMLGTNSDNAPTLGGGVILTANAIRLQQNGQTVLEDQYIGVSPQGKKLWSYTTTPGPVPPAYETPAATYHDGVFYEGSTVRKNLYAFNAQNGALLWKTPLQGYDYSNPTVVNGYIFATTTNGYVDTLSAATGQLLYAHHVNALLGSGEPILVDGTLFVGGTLGTVADVMAGKHLPGNVWAIPVRSMLPTGDSLAAGPPTPTPLIDWIILAAVLVAAAGVLMVRRRVRRS